MFLVLRLLPILLLSSVPLFPSPSVLSSSGPSHSFFPLSSNLPASNSSRSRWYPILVGIATAVASVVTGVPESIVVVGDGVGVGVGMVVFGSKMVIGFEFGV